MNEAHPMGTLRFFEEVVSFKIRRTFGFADYKFPGCDSRPQGFFGSLAASMRMSATGRFSDFETYVKVRGKASPEQGPKCSKAIQKVGFP